ncbi:MAG: hypothetical protein ACP5HG_17795, partial [Anaerolineae bacterium]
MRSRRTARTLHPSFPSHSQPHPWAVFTCVVIVALLVGGCSVFPVPLQRPPGEAPPEATPTTEGSRLPILPSLGPQRTLALLIGVGVLGFVLLVALIYALLRLRSRPSRSRPQAQPNSQARGVASQRGAASEDLLPEGTVLDDGRFLVLSGRATEAGHVYEVKATTPLTLCPTCYGAVGGADVRACPVCGTPLDGVQSEQPALLAREYRDAERFARISDIVARQLAHPAVVAPVAVFVETSFGEPRYFQVEPDVRDALASRLDLPQPLERVVMWGSTLARGLAY